MSQVERGLRFFALGTPGGPSRLELVGGRELDVSFWAHFACAQKETSKLPATWRQLAAGQNLLWSGGLKSTLTRLCSPHRDA